MTEFVYGIILPDRTRKIEAKGAPQDSINIEHYGVGTMSIYLGELTLNDPEGIQGYPISHPIDSKRAHFQLDVMEPHDGKDAKTMRNIRTFLEEGMEEGSSEEQDS